MERQKNEDFGFQHDDIRTINNLLQNSYRHGFPIIKELIQNANDAKSKLLSISQFNGFPNAKHPLLQNHPSILIYNDGDFTKKDNENIIRIHGDNKTNDGTVVGKYGLGMKSIFHLCDLFFYVSKITDSDIPNLIEARPLNPWFNDPENRHNDWSEFIDDDRTLLQKYFKTEYREKGFLLIIPLKLKQDEEHIINNCIYFNGKGEYFGPKNEFKEKIQQLLFILNATSEKKELKTVNINLPEYIEENISFDGIKRTKCFNKDSFPVAKKIVEQLIWPKNEKKPSDKTTCVLLRFPTKHGEEAKLTISYSVYLPLEQDEIFRIKTKYNYAIMLHGEFATDSGREKIHGYEDIAETGIDFNNLSSKTVNQAYIHWNQFLAQQRLYPLIPEILYKGIKEEVIDTEDINELFSVINSKFASKYNEFITKNKYLVKTFINSTTDWELFDAKKQVYFLTEDLGKHVYDFFKDTFLKKTEKDGKLVCVPQKEGIYFLKDNTNAETIQTIIEGFKDKIFNTPDGQAYLKKYISLFKDYFDINILFLFANRFIDNQHPELFFSFLKEHMLFNDFCNKYPELSIFPVEKINNNSKETIYCSINDINKWNNEKIIFYEDTQFKFAELYSLLSNNIIYLNKHNQYMRFNIKKADPALISENIGKLAHTVESINFNEYRNEFSLLLNKISNEQFYRLPIHKIVGSSGYHDILIDNSFRGTSQNNEILFPEGFNPPDIKFIDTDTFDPIKDKETRLLEELKGIEKIILFFKDKETIDNDIELEWLINNFDRNENNKLSEILKGKKWIPINDNGERKYINPEIIFSDNIVNIGTITNLKNNFDIHDIYTQSDIDSKIKEKIDNTEILKNINKKQGLLKCIAEQISKMQEYNIEFNIESADKLYLYTEILSKIHSQKYFNLLYLLYNDKTFTRDNKDYKDNIYIELFQNLNLSSAKKDINYYCDCIKSINDRGEINTVIIEIFNTWLMNLTLCNNFCTALFKEFKFPNKKEKWQYSTEIIFDPEEKEANVFAENELHDSSNEILIKNKNLFDELYNDISIDNKILKLSNNSSIDEIYKYFSLWIEKGINKKLLGFLLYILRGNFQKTSLEKALLNQRDISDIQNHLDYGLPINGKWNSLINKEQVFTEGNGFSTNIYQVDKILRMSLGGIPRSFCDKFDKTVLGSQTIEIHLKNNLQGINDNDVKYIIKYVLALSYNQWERQDQITSPDYEKLYEKFFDYKRHIEQTKNKLLKEVFFNIKHLALSTNTLFSEIYEKYDNFSRESNRGGEDSCIKEMKELIINDKNAQNIFREAIKKQLEKNQYDERSIPYELFQNADDAMAQRVEHEREIDILQFVFSINVKDKKLDFSYFGREIDRTYDEKSKKYYQYDLESMLSLNTSFKQGNVTGKYGLGFKSVYFVCDEPIIRSGDMHLKIVAGFYPEFYEDSKKLLPNETIIELKLKENNSDAIFTNFKNNAYFQAIFGKYIHTIKINNVEFKWEPIPYHKGSCYSFETGNINNENYLKLTIINEKIKTASLLFKFNKEINKVEPIENDTICKIWNTTPLVDDKTINFAINAIFTVDIGRKSFVKEEQRNTLLIQEIGKLLGNILVELYNEKNEILIASIFDVIIPAIVRGDKVLKELPVYAVKSFYNVKKLLPTGHSSLFKHYDKLILFYCPDKRDFEIKNEKSFFLNLKYFISESGAINNATLVTDSASKCWENIYSSSYISIKDIFILLKNLIDNRLTPKILEDFIKLMNYVKIKSTDSSLFCQIMLRNDNWSTVIGLLKSGQKLKDMASDKYKPESLDLLQKYFENIIYQNQNTGNISFPHNPDKLIKIYEWWKDKSKEEKQLRVNDYEESVYPKWFRKEELKSEPDTLVYNKAWFTLFAIAICQQLGRYNDKQHKGFLEYLDLQENSWFDTMLKSNSDVSESGWMTIIKKYYISNKINQPWQEWIKLLPQFFIIRYFLEDYITIIKDLDKMDSSEEFELESITIPRTNPKLSGTGIDLPAVNITLRIGLSFIIRELLRFDVIKPNRNIICHAFMPKERTAKIVMGENYDDKKQNQDKYKSSEIFKSINDKLNLKEYTFDGYYDIPMLIYKEEEENASVS